MIENVKNGNICFMKKLIAFVLILACLVPTAFFKMETNPIFEMQGVEKVCFVAEREYLEDEVESVRCGDLYFNYCSLETAKKNFVEFKKYIKGFQFYFKDVALDSILSTLKCEVVTTVEVEGREVLCGYTPYYENNIFVDEKKVNMQVACLENEIVLGFPLILTGY